MAEIFRVALVSWMLKEVVQQGRSERGGKRAFRYVEPLSDARTPLSDFPSILLVGGFQDHIECAGLSKDSQ